MSERPPVLLLVEDNPGDVRLTKEAFGETVFANTLRVVSDGEEALDFVHQRDEHSEARKPDIILLDWHLTGTSGEEVLTELKTTKGLKQIPVIVLTGSQSEREIATAYENYANACVTKPSDPDVLADGVRAFEKFWHTFAQLPVPAEESTKDETL